MAGILQDKIKYNRLKKLTPKKGQKKETLFIKPTEKLWVIN